MTRLKDVEKKILLVEGFKVTFTQAGKDVRGDKEGIPQYPYGNAAPSTWTVGEWKAKRFRPQYPGYDVRVFDGSGAEATGQKPRFYYVALGNKRWYT